MEENCLNGLEDLWRAIFQVLIYCFFSLPDPHPLILLLVPTSFHLYSIPQTPGY